MLSTNIVPSYRAFDEEINVSHEDDSCDYKTATKLLKHRIDDPVTKLKHHTSSSLSKNKNNFSIINKRHNCEYTSSIHEF